ncbi:MAG: helix-turn-helix transcriptional regulator [Ruminococcus sp.]|nr:helix-turn-helix transcriptional regulator [Ruminococcus sp.]
MSTLNERIKNRRKELGLTQKELADMLSISDKTVSRWESGNQMPDAILMPDLSSALQMSLDELYGINENNFDSNENCTCDANEYPKEKVWLNLSYKISTLVSVFIILLGCMFKCYYNYIYADDPFYTAGMVLIIIGFVILVLIELAYNITYRDSKIYNPLYLRTDIVFSGIAVLSIIPLLCFTDAIYDLFIALLLAIMYKVAISFQKRKLIEHNIIAVNKTSKLFTILFVVFTLLFIAVVIFFKYFYYQFFYDGSYTVALGLQTMVSQNTVSSGVGFPYFTYMFGLSVIIYIILIIDYIDLCKKSKLLISN